MQKERDSLMWQDDMESAMAQTGDIFVSAFQEQLDADDVNNSYLWAFCLRVENNSEKKIRLLKKDFCITDNCGHSYFINGEGFHGELPDLEPGECFEFEDTIGLNSAAAVLYGTCAAQAVDGTEIKIKLPIVQLAALETTSHFNYN